MNKENASKLWKIIQQEGINSLRVVDASVLPNVVSGNIGAPVMMIAARAADWILSKNQLEPLKANFKFDQI